MINPFKERGKRAKGYYLFIFVSWLATFTFVIITIKNNKTSDLLSEFAPDYLKKKDDPSDSYEHGSLNKLIWMIIIFAIYMFTLIVALRVAILLGKEGTSKSLKKMVKRRHFFYLFFFSVVTFTTWFDLNHTKLNWLCS